MSLSTADEPATSAQAELPAGACTARTRPDGPVRGALSVLAALLVAYVATGAVPDLPHAEVVDAVLARSQTGSTSSPTSFC